MPDADRILKLEQMETDEAIDAFDTEYGHSDSFALSDALW